MVIINGEQFYEIPGSCGTCPFFYNGSTSMQHGGEWGHCRLMDKMHRGWRNPPSKCMSLFKKAFKMPEGSNLVIVYKDNDENE